MAKKARLSITYVRELFSRLGSALGGMDLNMADASRILVVFLPAARNIAEVADSDPFWGGFIRERLRRGIQYSNPLLRISVTLQGETASSALQSCIGDEEDLARNFWRSVTCITALLSLLSSQEEVSE
ncbi:MAG: hypothetical protein ACP5NY_04160 [Thermocladium sp.]